MTEKTEVSEKKKLKHVKVYNRLYELIQNGTYPAGTQLPSETALSEQMGVSRMTLRKALALFIEDGLVKNVPGVGHFICSPSDNRTTSLDLSKNIHPLHSYCTRKPDDTEFQFRIEPPTRSILDTLNCYTPAVIIADRWYKEKEVPFAYSLSFLPIEFIGEKHINLNHPTELSSYLETLCYQEMASCRRIFSYSTAGNFTAKKYTLSNHDSFLLIQETICDEQGNIVISSKHYIPSDLYRLELELSNHPHR